MMARPLAWVLFAVVLCASVVVVADGAGRLSSSRRSRRHQRVTQGLACPACHTPAGWKLEVSGDHAKGFDHSRTGFPLTGFHRAARCTDCHRSDRPAGRDCAGCHQDPHQARMGDQCDSCHMASGWRDLQVFDVHRRTRFPLNGMHALADCTQCHTRVGERQWSTPPAECFACHSDDYLSDDTHPLHRGDANQLPFPRRCEQCHQTRSWLPARFDPSLLVQPLASRGAGLRRTRDHDLHFVISRGPHRAASCQSCHLDANRPRPVSCTGCHEHNPVRLTQQHRGQPVSPQADACTSCHLGGGGR